MARKSRQRRYRSKDAAIAAIARGLSATQAARAVGVTRGTLYEWRKDPEFERQWQDALECRVEDIESKLYELAMGGYFPAIAYSLKCWRPETYNRRIRLAHGTDPDAGPVTVDVRGRPIVHRTCVISIPDNGRDRADPDDPAGGAYNVQPRRTDTVHLPQPLPEHVLQIVDPDTGEVMSMQVDGHLLATEDIPTMVAAIRANNATADDGDETPDRGLSD
jgi:hypothetical protein